jgi:4-carboxymuconolactone decarboxylase
MYLIRFAASPFAWFVVASALLVALPVRAQDRLPAIPAERLTPDQQQAVTEFRAARKAEPTGPFVAMLRSPEVMSRARAMGDYLRFTSRLPPRQSELVILMAARSWTQQYEWAVHYPIALKAGVTPEVARAIAERRRPTGLSADDATLYDFCDELLKTQTVADATYTRMVAAFGEPGVVDTVGILGYYTMLAMMLNTARTPAPDNGAPRLEPLR